MNDISFLILGRPFYAHNIPDFLGRWFEKNWHFPEHSLPEVSYKTTLKVLKEAPELGQGIRRETEPDINDEVFLWHQDGDRWWFQEGDSGIQFIMGPDEFNISVWGLNEKKDLRKTFTALYITFMESLRATDLFPLHASVVIKNGNATAFTGQSGMGKSTMLVNAMADGMSPLAEDFSWFDPHTSMLYGWDQGLRFWEDGWEKLPREFREIDWQEDFDGKMLLPWDKLDIERTVSAPLDQVLVLKRAAEENTSTVKQQIPPHQAVRALWEATGVPLTEYTKKKVAKGIGKLISNIEVASLYI